MARCDRLFLQQDPLVRRFWRAKDRRREAYHLESRAVVRDRAIFFWERERGHDRKWWQQLCRLVADKRWIRQGHRMAGSKMSGACCNGGGGRAPPPSGELRGGGSGWRPADPETRATSDK